MTKSKVLRWKEINKVVKIKVGTDQVLLKVSNSLITRLLMIARSTRDIDL